MAVAAAVAFAQSAAAPAQASDAGLRKVVAQQEKTLAPLADAFAIAIQTPTSAVGIEALTEALQNLRVATREEALAAARIDVTSARSKRGLLQFLAAVDGEYRALLTYGVGLQSVFDEEPAAAARTFTKAAAQLASAAKKEQAAKKLLRVAGSA